MELQLYAVYNTSQQVEDITKDLPGLLSSAENHYSGSRTAVCNIQDPCGHGY